MMSKKYSKRRTDLKSAPIIFAVISLAYFLLSCPDKVALSVQDALILCAKSVIPSLFPFMVLSSFIVEFSIANTLGRFLKPVTKALFNLPGEAGTVILMGLIGGFPVGPKMTADLLKKNFITERQARALCLFSINAGPAFVIGTVGYSLLGNAKYGVLLYVSMVISSLAVGLFVCMFLGHDVATDQKNKAPVTDIKNPTSLGDALCTAVNAGTSAILNICAFIVIFSAIISGLQTVIKNTEVLRYLSAVLEVTQGLRGISQGTALGSYLLPVMAAVLSFCGLCVHAQVHDSLRTVGLPYTKFFVSRLACAALSFLFCRAALLVFPDEYAVFSNMSGCITADTSLSIFASITVLIMSVLLIFDLDIPSELC